MPQPRALTGKRRLEALSRAKAGEKPQSVADAMGVSRGAILRLLAREAGNQPRPEADRPAIASDDQPDDLDLRVELRKGLLADFRANDDAKERAVLAREIDRLTDSIARSKPKLDDDEGRANEDAQSFDAYMLRLVQRVRAVKSGSIPGVSLEEEPAGEVGPGDRRSSG